MRWKLIGMKCCRSNWPCKWNKNYFYVSAPVQSTSHQSIHFGLCTALTTSAYIELQVYSKTCCWLYIPMHPKYQTINFPQNLINIYNDYFITINLINLIVSYINNLMVSVNLEILQIGIFNRFMMARQQGTISVLVINYFEGANCI
jgi:hypothetical protein